MRLPVLLLDDDKDWLRVCLARLPQASYALEPTVSLSVALERLSAVRHPVVICELRLIGFGEEGRFSLLDEAKIISKFTQVIVVAPYGGAVTNIALKAIEKGASTYLTRPIDFSELDRCVVMAIETWRQKVEELVNLGFFDKGPELEFLRALGVKVPSDGFDGPSGAIIQPDASIVRIFGAGERIVGMGFLVSNRCILTCAHVIAEALGLPSDVSDAPQDDIRIDFPLVACNQFMTTQVVYWQPDSDVAGLELIEPPPPGSEPACLVTAADMWGHSFRALGFPTGYPQGVWASGILHARVANDWLQVVDTVEPGHRVAPGFSGSPVWDGFLKGVVGMVVAADTQEWTKAAYLIPADALLRTWPDLACS